MARVAFLMDLPKDSGAGRYAVELQKRIGDPFAIDYLYFDYEQRALVLEGDVERRILAKTYRLPAGDNKVWFWMRLRNKIPEYDRYHFITPNLSFLVPKGKKSLVTCHDIAPLFMPTSFWEKRWRRYLYSGLKRADVLIADSDHTRRDLCRTYGFSEAKIPVIPLGVDLSVFRPLERAECRKALGLPLDKKIILNVSIDKWRKNLAGLVRAFGLLTKVIPDTLLLHVGKPSMSTISLVRSLGLEEKINHIEPSTEAELAKYYNSADVFAFPSLYEGFGLPVLEAMACGTPVVASNRTSIPEVVGDAGILIDPEDVLGLSEAIKRVLTEPTFAQDFSYRGLDRITRFSWENTAKATESVYAKILHYEQTKS